MKTYNVLKTVCMAASMLFIMHSFVFGQKQDILVFAGISHTALGNANLAIVDSVLVVSNIGSSGEDGFSISAYQAEGFIPEFDFTDLTLPIGASLVAETFGLVDGVPNQSIGTMTLLGDSNGVEITPDFGAIGALTYELQLLNNGLLVYSRSGMTGPSGTTNGLSTGTSAKACCRVIVYSLGFSILTDYDVNDGPTITNIDQVLFFYENPTKTTEYVDSLTVKASAINDLKVTGEELAVFDPFFNHSVLGEALFSAERGPLTLENIGSSGQDGVSIRLGEKPSQFRAKFDPIDLNTSGGSAPGIILTAIGTFDGTPSVFLGELSMFNITGQLEIDADYTSIGDDSVRIEVYDNGAFVGATTEAAGTVGFITGNMFLEECGKPPYPPDPPCFWIGFTEVVTFNASNQSFAGNEFRLLAANTGGAINNLASFDIRAANIGTFTILDESIEIITSIETDNSPEIPMVFILQQNYPNPFNPTTTIRYALPSSQFVMLKVYNVRGREVTTLVNERQTAGEKSVVWNGRDNLGKEVSSGIYIYRIRIDEYLKSHKMVLIR